jgi:hypothetical protein
MGEDMIGLFFIATGKYQRFVPDITRQAEALFLPDHDKKIVVITEPHLPWPLPTLLRYHLMLESGALDFDHIYYMDVDMRIERPIGHEIIGDLVAVEHPGYVGKTRGLPFEHRPESACFCNRGLRYFAGGFQGGSRWGYGEAIQRCRSAINLDLANGIIPTWHDESAWNWFLVDNTPTVVLSPDYCSRPFERHETRRIVALDKNHAEMRS